MRRPLAQGISILLAVLLVGCGSTAGSPSVAPEPTATATPTPSPTPIPTPSASPSESAAVDAAAGLSISSPYELEPLDDITAGAISGAMEAALGELSSAFHFGYRSVLKSGEPVEGSLVMVMDFRSEPLTSAPGFLESVAGGVAGTTSGSVETTTIHDHEVALITTDILVYAAYQSDTAVVVVMTPTQELSEEIVTALIAAE